MGKMGKRLGKIEYRSYWLLFGRILLAGFALGAVFAGGAYRFRSGDVMELKVFGIGAFLERGIDARVSFRYLLKLRMTTALGGILLGLTPLGMMAAVAVVSGYGFLCGVFLTAAVLQNGLRGFALFLGVLFPQALLYVPALLLMAGVCGAASRRTGAVGGLPSGELLSAGLWYLLGLVVLLWGILLESYLSPVLMAFLMSF